MSFYSPTPAQQRLLDYLVLCDHLIPGFVPSIREMHAEVGGNRAGIHRKLEGLIERGHLRRAGSGQGRKLEIMLTRQTQMAASRAPDGAPLYFVPAPHRASTGAAA